MHYKKNKSAESEEPIMSKFPADLPNKYRGGAREKDGQKPKTIDVVPCKRSHRAGKVMVSRTPRVPNILLERRYTCFRDRQRRLNGNVFVFVRWLGIDLPRAQHEAQRDGQTN